jgi:hypothetical protein
MREPLVYFYRQPRKDPGPIDTDPRQPGRYARRMTATERLDVIRVLATYILGAMVLIGCFTFIFTSRGDPTQAWTLAGVIVTALIVGQAKDRSFAAGAEAGSTIPTVTTSGNPPTTRVEAADKD